MCRPRRDRQSRELHGRSEPCRLRPVRFPLARGATRDGEESRNQSCEHHRLEHGVSFHCRHSVFIDTQSSGNGLMLQS
jgi:hypothetical protein